MNRKREQPESMNLAKFAYSIQEIATSTGLSTRFLRTQCYQGKLEHCRIGRRVVV